MYLDGARERLNSLYPTDWKDSWKNLALSSIGLNTMQRRPADDDMAEDQETWISSKYQELQDRCAILMSNEQLENDKIKSSRKASERLCRHNAPLDSVGNCAACYYDK